MSPSVTLGSSLLPDRRHSGPRLHVYGQVIHVITVHVIPEFQAFSIGRWDSGADQSCRVILNTGI